MKTLHDGIMERCDAVLANTKKKLLDRHHMSDDERATLLTIVETAFLTGAASALRQVDQQIDDGFSQPGDISLLCLCEAANLQEEIGRTFLKHFGRPNP